MRSLVGGIQGCAELLTNTLDEEDRYLTFQILEGTAAIERVLSDLLCFSHRPEPLMFPVSVADFAKQLLEVVGDLPGHGHVPSVVLPVLGSPQAAAVGVGVVGR